MIFEEKQFDPSSHLYQALKNGDTPCFGHGLSYEKSCYLRGGRYLIGCLEYRTTPMTREVALLDEWRNRSQDERTDEVRPWWKI